MTTKLVVNMANKSLQTFIIIQFWKKINYRKRHL